MRTAAEQAEFNARVAALRAEQDADKTATLATDLGHFNQYVSGVGYIYYGRGKRPSDIGVPVMTRNMRGYTVLVHAETRTQIAKFGSSVKFWAGRA